MAKGSHVLALCLAIILLAACVTPSTPSPLPSSPTATSEPTPTEQPEAPSTEAEPTVTVAGESPAEEPTTAPEATATPDATPVGELDDDVAVLVNGQTVTRETYERQIAQARHFFLQQPSWDAASEAGKQALARLEIQVLQWLIDQALIEQAAAAEGVRVSDQDIEAVLQAMRGDDLERFEAWLAANGLTETELREQVRYDLLTAAMRDRVTAQLPREVQQIRVRHILTSEESAAKRAVQALQAGGNFIALARQVSEDATTRDTGGDLGFMPRGVMPPTFDEVAFSLGPGEISDVVRSEFGFHVIQVVEIDPARRVPDELWPVVQERALATWLEERRAQSEIQVATWATERQEG